MREYYNAYDPYTITNYAELVEAYDELRGEYNKTYDEMWGYYRDLGELSEEVEELKFELKNYENLNTDFENFNILGFLFSIVIFIIIGFCFGKYSKSKN